MNKIDIAMPSHIGANKVKEIIENFLKNNSDFRCEVTYVNTVRDESLYMVEYKESLALYHIGFAVCGIEKAYPKPLTHDEALERAKIALANLKNEQWQVLPPEMN